MTTITLRQAHNKLPSGISIKTFGEELEEKILSHPAVRIKNEYSARSVVGDGHTMVVLKYLPKPLF